MDHDGQRPRPGAPHARHAVGAACLALAVFGLTPARETRPERPLGAAHASLKAAVVEFFGDADELWGLDRETHLSLELFGALDVGGRHYLGGELGRTRAGDFTDAQGDRLTDITVTTAEINEKAVFGLEHGMTIAVGGGTALFLASGEEVFEGAAGPETAPLDDFGFALQGLAGFDWRTGRLLLGIEVKLQMAFDLFEQDYSNLRLGARVGFVF